MTRASTSDEDIETLLTCGDKLRRYCADIQAKSSVQTQELIEWLERAEQILRATEQGTKGVQKAVSNTFAKQIVQVLTTRNARSGRRRGSKRQRGSETIDGDAADGSDASASPSLALQVSARCACCFVLLLRLFAPACPFSDEEMEKVFTRGLFSEDGTSALVTRLCLRPPPLSPQPQPQEANQGGAKGKKTRGGRGKRKEEDRGAAEAAAANAEVYQRGLFVLETLREVKACLLVLDLESEDSLCALLATLFRCVNARNVSDLREVVTGLAGEVMEEGAADLGPGPWEAFLMECVGPNGAAQLTHLEKRARAITKRKIGAAAAPLDPWDWEPRADTPGAGGSDEEGPAEALSGDSSEGQGEDDESQTSGELAAMDGAADGALGDTSASAIVARAVLRQKALVLGPHVQKFLAGVLGDRPAGALVHDDRAYQALIYALYLTCPKIMIPVLPRLSASLFVDVQSKRVNAVDLLGHFLVSVRGLDFARDYCGSLFKDFLSRFLDKSAVVRMRMITIAECVIVRHMRENNNAGLGPLEGEPPAPAETETGTEDTEDAQGVALRSEPCVMALLEGLTDKVVDPDERVRLAAVSAVGHIFTLSPSCLGQAQYEHFRGRLRDTRVSVRAECALHLARAFGAHIRRVHNDGGSWQDEERVQEIPTSLLKAYNTDKCLRERPRARHHGDHDGDGGGAGGGGRTSLAVPVLERALGRGLWPDCLLAAEVVRHWVVVFSNQDKGDQDALFKCLQLKLAFRNSIRQVLRLREEEKNPFMADQGQEDPEARGRKKASIAKLCQRIAAGWLSDPAKSASGLQRIANLEDDKVLSTLLSLTESRDGEERLELRSALLASVQYSREVQSAMAQVCNYLVHAPIGGNHVMALLGILGQGQGSQGSQEEEEEAHREFLPHCRRFALRLARADPSLFTQPEATRGLLEMLLEDDEDTCLASLEILELTHTKQRFRARDRGTGKEGEDMAAPVIASDSAEETKLVRLVSDHRSDVSTRAISLAHALLSSDRAHSVLREEAKRSLRILAKHGDQNQMSLTNVGPAALAFGVIGNIAHVAPKVLQASLLDVVNAVCFVLTNPLPDLDPSKAPPKGRRRSREGGEAAMAPHRLFTAAADCLWRVLCPRSSDSGSPALPKEVRRAVPNAVQYLANMVDLENPLMEGERRHECPSAHKAEVRLAAAIAILRIARRHDLAFSVYREVCLVVQDPSRETRSKVAAEMNALIASFQSSRPPEVTKAAKFAAALALAGADPNQENREVAGGFLLRYFVHTYENFKKDARHSKSRPYTIMRPEFLLVYLIHLLAHHPDYPTSADVAHYGVQSVFAPFQQMVLFVLEILTRGNQVAPRAGKAQTKQKQKQAKARGAGLGGFECDFGLVDKILRTIKEAEDAAPGAVEGGNGTHVVADVAWALADDIRGALDSGAAMAAEAFALEDDNGAKVDHREVRVPLPKGLYGKRTKSAGAMIMGSALPEGLVILGRPSDGSDSGKDSSPSKGKNKRQVAKGRGAGPKKRKALSPISTSSLTNLSNSNTGTGAAAAVKVKQEAVATRAQPKRGAKARAASAIQISKETSLSFEDDTF